MSRRTLAVLVVVLAAALPYLPVIDDYFIQDDFGVVALLSDKPFSYFPRWFVMPWTEDIWGYVPDEIRPFVALTYRLGGLWGAASPVANHVINIGFHALNAWLVLAMARSAAGVSPGPAVFGALVFALLPMQTESVAWITGRVDSMPACVYMASFLLYAYWRARGVAAVYAWSVVLCFVALFSKQNAVTLGPALVLYDAIVARRPVRPTWGWLRPYVPFVLLTLGYLALRWVLFGEVARERMLSGERIGFFLQDLSTHVRRMVFGEPGLRIPVLRAAALIGAAGASVAAVGVALGARGTGRTIRPAAFFLLVWIGLAVAPTVVAGYASPRHMYLASAGWAIGLALALEVFWHARPVPWMRRAGVMLSVLVLLRYGLLLGQDVRLWETRARVSHQAVIDLEREARASPPGTLVIAGAPGRSWNFALPHAIKPPFTSEDLTRRMSVVSHSSLHCCPAPLWNDYTRGALSAWLARPDRPPVIAFHWNPDTGKASRVSSQDDPFLATMVPWLLESPDVTTLDRRLLEVTDKFALGGRP